MDTITITTGVNGYPENLREAAYFRTLFEAQEYAAAHGGQVETVKRRDGWQFWQSMGDKELVSYTVDGWASEDYDEALRAAGDDDDRVFESHDAYNYDVWQYAYAVETKEAAK